MYKKKNNKIIKETIVNEQEVKRNIGILKDRISTSQRNLKELEDLINIKNNKIVKQ